MLTFQVNSMLVRQIQDVISHLGLNWDPLTRPIYIHHVHPEQQKRLEII